MSDELKRAIEQIDEYIGPCGDPDVSPLGSCQVPVRFLQALRKAMRG